MEFTAHTAPVNCLALGHKSGRVLVTGGDDKKVNLWAVGKENCIMVSSSVIDLVTTVKCYINSNLGILDMLLSVRLNMAVFGFF